MTVPTTIDEADAGPKQRVSRIPPVRDLRVGVVDSTHPTCGNAPFGHAWFSLPT